MYENYKKARDKSWEVLLACGINSIPIDLSVILEYYRVQMIPFSKCALTQLFQPDVLDGDGFSTLMNHRPAIFLNDKKGTRDRRRFTVGHELGHILLGHELSEIQYRNSETDDNLLEMEANVFSRDILMPACILAALNVHTAEEIMNLCHVSRTSAEIRAERLKMLYQRRRFGDHPLESKLLAQFGVFIKQMKL